YHLAPRSHLRHYPAVARSCRHWPEKSRENALHDWQHRLSPNVNDPQDRVLPTATECLDYSGWGGLAQLVSSRYRRQRRYQLHDKVFLSPLLCERPALGLKIAKTTAATRRLLKEEMRNAMVT